MKFNYEFSNLCGTVYKQGNLLFTPDGNSLLSPVGNRITVFDLVNSTSRTLPFENRKDIRTLALSPNGHLLLSVDTDGYAILSHLGRRSLLHRFNFKEKVLAAQFSPDGDYFLVTHKNHVQTWHTPGRNREFAPFVKLREYTGQYDDTTCVAWAPNSKMFVAGSRDSTCRIFTLNPVKGFRPITLTGHRSSIIGCYFSQDGKSIYSVAKDGALYVWKWNEATSEAKTRAKEADSDSSADESSSSEEDEFTSYALGTWSIDSKHFFNQNHARAISASFHAKSNIMVVGFDSGVFAMYELPGFQTIHSLSISQQHISSVAISPSGEWLAFGAPTYGQLLVWEWQSESYILKQQGHILDMNVLAYSSNGLHIATGGDDGKVKLWDTTTGFCFVTFTEHTGPVTGLDFPVSGHALFSCSLDGTVQAHDLVRYRKFRTMLSPKQTQFTCLAADPSGEVVCAGSVDTFEIFVWSVQTGRILDVLSGHQGPISSLMFDPAQGTLASGSWDKTVRLWNVYNSKSNPESLVLNADVLAVAFRPDGKQVASSTLDGQIQFWDPEDALMTGFIEGKRDIRGGRRMNDVRTANNNSSTKHFSTLCYSADGQCIIAAGNSKYVCIYEVNQRVLLRKFQLSMNRSLDGVLDFLNSKLMTEAGPTALMDISDSESDDEPVRGSKDKSLPGSKRGGVDSASKRRVRPSVRSSCVRFSPTGRAWAAATSEGLMIYSLDETVVFDPFDLDIEVTPQSIEASLSSNDFVKAMVLSFRLNEESYIRKAFEHVPIARVDIVASQIPAVYLPRLLNFIGKRIDNTRHFEFYLQWVHSLFTHHGFYMKKFVREYMTALRALQKGMLRRKNQVTNLCAENRYMLSFLSQAPKISKASQAAAVAATVSTASTAAGGGSAAQEAQDNDDFFNNFQANMDAGNKLVTTQQQQQQQQQDEEEEEELPSQGSKGGSNSRPRRRPSTSEETLGGRKTSVDKNKTTTTTTTTRRSRRTSSIEGSDNNAVVVIGDLPLSKKTRSSRRRSTSSVQEAGEPEGPGGKRVRRSRRLSSQG